MVFLEGIVSFFSPCVIPLIPLYIGYLAGNAKTTDEEGNIKYKRRVVMLHTVFFVLGISTAFFILGLGFSNLGNLTKEYRDVMSRVGGVIIIILGFNQLGVIKIGFLNKEFRLNKSASYKKINPITAFLMGFVFSFAWTPCVGPALASVLILASSSNSSAVGNLLVLVYAAGFIIPFLFLGLFTGETLNFIKKRGELTKVIIKIGGVILIMMGAMLFLGTFNKFEALFNNVGTQSEQNMVSTDKNRVEDKEASLQESSGDGTNPSDSSNSEDSDKKQPIYPIKLKDQNGNTVNVGDFKGKVVFLNFFATWCPPCKEEIPDIQKMYEDLGYNKKDVIVLAVTSPNQGREGSVDYIKKFIKEHKITYPVLMDETGEIFGVYGVYSLPTTFMIDRDSNVYGYVTGMMTREMMDSYINKTKEVK